MSYYINDDDIHFLAMLGNQSSQNSSIHTGNMWAAPERLYHYFNKMTDKQLNRKDHFISQITPLSFLKRCITNCRYFKYILYFPVKLNTLKKNPQRNKYKARQFHFMICFEHCLVLHLLWWVLLLFETLTKENQRQPSLLSRALCLSAVNTNC